MCWWDARDGSEERWWDLKAQYKEGAAGSFVGNAGKQLVVMAALLQSGSMSSDRGCVEGEDGGQWWWLLPVSFYVHSCAEDGEC